MDGTLWGRCLERLRLEVPAGQFEMVIRPLQADHVDGGLQLYAPNYFVSEMVRNRYLPLISRVAGELSERALGTVALSVGNARNGHTHTADAAGDEAPAAPRGREKTPPMPTGLKAEYSFDTFIEGKSNQMARAACQQVAQNPGTSFNPLFICGGVGLGKTHLMQAVGNAIRAQSSGARVVYLHSERFVSEMVRALQQNRINDFKAHYRSVDALLIDDIQFFANKERSQEEFFHTFNALLENQQQIVLTCDVYPKEVQGVEERLKSRFSWGLTVAIEPAELETRVAILLSKAVRAGVELPEEVAFFIGKRFRSNIRELEGALNRIICNASFCKRAITLEFAREALKDLLQLQERQVSIENIQKTVAEYFNVRISDFTSKSRRRSVARPRQFAMALAKELTNHSLPEIGRAYGGRDHTTVLHAVRRVAELRRSEARCEEDYLNLLRLLTT